MPAPLTIRTINHSATLLLSPVSGNSEGLLPPEVVVPGSFPTGVLPLGVFPLGVLPPPDGGVAPGVPPDVSPGVLPEGSSGVGVGVGPGTDVSFSNTATTL